MAGQYLEHEKKRSRSALFFVFEISELFLAQSRPLFFNDGGL
jgi:hypothetical protein